MDSNRSHGGPSDAMHELIVCLCGSIILLLSRLQSPTEHLSWNFGKELSELLGRGLSLRQHSSYHSGRAGTQKLRARNAKNSQRNAFGSVSGDEEC